MELTTKQLDTQRDQKRYLFRSSIVLMIIMILVLFYASYQISYNRDTRYSVLAGIAILIILIGLAVIRLNHSEGSGGVKTLKGSANLMIGAIWLACLVTPIFYSGSGFFTTLLGFFFIALVAARIFNQRQIALIMGVTVITGILAIFIDWYREVALKGLTARPELLSPWIALGTTLCVVTVIFIYWVTRFRTNTMRIKLLIAFMIVGVFSSAVVAWVAVINVHESLLTIGRQDALTAPLESGVRNIELAALLVVAAIAIAALPLSNTITAPVKRLTAVTNAVISGDLETRAKIETEDEFGVLAGAINQMTSDLKQNMIDLEQHVSDRTRELEKRSLQLQAVAEIGRAAATIRNPEELLSMVTRLISDRFNFYHVGIFLLEEESSNVKDPREGIVHYYAVLRAANSEGGKRMLARGHKLAIGQQGIVGYVAGTGNPRIALDVGEDPQYFNNPDLPLTRSEMALALSISGKIIGVLDVQSTQAGAFASEDVAILQIMADLVAIAIDNARLFTESEEALEASRRAFGELSRRAWMEVLASKEELSYTSLDYPYMVENGGQEQRTNEMMVEKMSGKKNGGDVAGTFPLSLPIKVRDTVIGYLDTYKPGESGGWTPEEYDMVTTIIDQLGVALESARLYEASQSQAERERLIGEVASRMRESLDVDSVLRTAVQELRRSLGISQVEVRMKHSGFEK